MVPLFARKYCIIGCGRYRNARHIYLIPSNLHAVPERTITPIGST